MDKWAKLPQFDDETLKVLFDDIATNEDKDEIARQIAKHNDDDDIGRDPSNDQNYLNLRKRKGKNR